MLHHSPEASVDLDRVDCDAVMDALNGDVVVVACEAADEDCIFVVGPGDGEEDTVDDVAHDGVANGEEACYVVAMDALDDGAYSLVDAHTYFAEEAVVGEDDPVVNAFVEAFESVVAA